MVFPNRCVDVSGATTATNTARDAIYGTRSEYSEHFHCADLLGVSAKFRKLYGFCLFCVFRSYFVIILTFFAKLDVSVCMYLTVLLSLSIYLTCRCPLSHCCHLFVCVRAECRRLSRRRRLPTWLGRCHVTGHKRRCLIDCPTRLCRCSASVRRRAWCCVLFCSVLFCSVLFCSVLFCSVPFCSVLFCSVLHCSVLCFCCLSLFVCMCLL